MDTRKMDLFHYSLSSLRFMYLVNKYAVFKGKTFMLWLLSRCSISEFLGAQDHKNEAAEQCEEPAGSWSAALLQPSQAALGLQNALSLGRAAASEPHLAAFIAEFPAGPTALLHCLCLSLGLMSAPFSRGRHTECSSRGSDGTQKAFFSQGAGQELSRVWSVQLSLFSGQCQARESLFQWAARDLQSSLQPTLLRARE